MNILNLPSGKYVIGVSGGVDSVVLLDILSKQPKTKLIVAHVEHGIRGSDSKADAEFVKELAEHYGLEFELHEANLGKDASEDEARQARHSFLRQCREKHQADGIVLAHHQDDVLETIILNIIRGTGWRGLCSLRSHPPYYRPLLEVTKAEIMAYAKEHNLVWHEDTTNSDSKYTRNYIRHKIMPRLDDTAKIKLADLWRKQQFMLKEINGELEQVFNDFSSQHTENRFVIPRYKLIMADAEAAVELLQYGIRKLNGSVGLQRPQAEGLLLFIKTAKNGTVWRPGDNVEARIDDGAVIVELQQT